MPQGCALFEKVRDLADSARSEQCHRPHDILVQLPHVQQAPAIAAAFGLERCRSVSGGMEGTMPPPGDLDPKTVINGTIDVAPGLAGKVKPGDVIFLSLKSVDPTTGELKRPPLAVDRLDVQKLPVTFELSNHKNMIAG